MEFEPIDRHSGFASAVFVTRCLSSVLLVICTIFGLRTFKSWLRKYVILKALPGPDDTFPPLYLIKLILHNSRDENRTKGEVIDTFSVIRGLVDALPDPTEGITKVYMGFTPMVFLSRASAAETILVDSVNISKAITYKFMDHYIPSSLITATGEIWRFQRKLVTPAFHFKALDGFMTIFNKHAANFVDYLNKSPTQEAISLFRETTKCTTNVIGETSLGHDLDAFSGENHYGTALTKLQKLFLSRSSRPYMWIDSFYYKFTREGAFVKRMLDMMHELSGRIVNQRLAERKEEELKADKVNGRSAPPSPAGKKIRAFIEIFLDAHKQNPTLVTKRLVQSGVDTMLFAGQDTTATAASWTIFLLGHNPEIQNKCRQEVFRVMGPDPNTPVTSEHLKTLKYLEAVLKESMRLYPPIPLIGRQLETDIKIKETQRSLNRYYKLNSIFHPIPRRDGFITIGNGKSHTIPAGVHMFTSIYHMHRDPEYFPDPEKFDPGRFLDENAPHKANPLSYVPFSCGPRNCIGQKFALMELKVVMAHLLRNCQWTSITPQENLVLLFEIVLRARGDLRVKIEPLRSNANIEGENRTSAPHQEVIRV